MHYTGTTPIGIYDIGTNCIDICEIGTNYIVPQSFITGYEKFEEAVIDMDLIEADEDLFSDIGWDLTVLEMYHVGDTVVWKNKLPMTPVA